MIESTIVKLLLIDGREIECSLEISGAEAYRLRAVIPPGQIFEGGGPDLFEALRSLQIALAGQGRLLCAGARVDVYPSGMSRSMGGGRKAYIHKLGSPAQREQLVDIFSYASPDTIGTPAEQDDYHRKWVASITSKSEKVVPSAEESEEAKAHPNGWVYRIAGRFDKDAAVPPEAIVGAWRVGPDGRITGEFVPNPKYDPKRWPLRKKI